MLNRGVRPIVVAHADHPHQRLVFARELIAGETLADSVDYSGDGAGEKATIEGRELRIAVSRA